jgi:hypothetical protein
VIEADANAVGKNLCRHMTIAEMPRDARKMMRVACSNFCDRLACCDHAHDTAILKFQSIAVVKLCCFRKIEQEHGVARATHGNAAAMAAVMRELDGVGFASAVPVTVRKNFGGADHTQLSFVVPAKAGTVSLYRKTIPGLAA